MNDRPRVGVLVPAAGRGRRMGGERKQFRALGSSPILHHTLRLFDTHPGVDGIIVAVPSIDVAVVRTELHSLGLSKLLDVVAGGASRQASVARALSALPPPIDVVLVHDAVRPFLSADRIAAVIDAVAEFGAAALAIPVSDTLRDGTDGFFGATVPRAGLYRMQTPQGSRRDWFEEAHQKARQEGYEETDDVALLRRAGYAVRVVEGTSTNMKLTTSEDWVLARAIWEKSLRDEKASARNEKASQGKKTASRRDVTESQRDDKASHRDETASQRDETASQRDETASRPDETGSVSGDPEVVPGTRADGTEVDIESRSGRASNGAGNSRGKPS